MKYIVKNNQAIFDPDVAPQIASISDNKLGWEPVPFTIADDETNKPLMDCARASKWISNNETKMTSFQARKIKTLTPPGDIESLTINIEGITFQITLDDFYRILEPETCDRTTIIEDPSLIEKIIVKSVDTEKNYMENDAIVLSDNTTLSFFDCAVKINLSEEEYIFPCVMDYEGDGNLTCIVKQTYLTKRYYFIQPTLYVNEFYQIKHPDDIDQYRTLGSEGYLSQDDVIGPIFVKDFDFDKSYSDPNGVILEDESSLSFWDIATIHNDVLFPIVLLYNYSSQTEEPWIALGQIMAEPQCLLANYEITHFDEFKYFKKINYLYRGYGGEKIFPDSLQSISLPPAMYSIGTGLFEENINLESVNIPNSVVRIEDQAFCKCQKLTSINIPNSVTSIYNRSFQSSALITLELPDSVEFLGQEAFAYCNNLTSVKLSNNLSILRDNIFSHCENLSSIKIPDSVECVDDVFSGCISLPVENNIRYADTCLIEVIDNTLETYTIKEGTKYIEPGAFYNCYNLTNIKLPETIKLIAGYVFSNCDNLPIEDNIQYADTCAVKIIDTTLETYTIKNGTKYLNANLFSQCSNVLSINLPDTLKSIGQHAFTDCSKIENLILPNQLEYICKDVFYNCNKLTSINIPMSVKYIDSAVFTIKTLNFEELGGFTEITFNGNIPPKLISVDNDIFYAWSDGGGRTPAIENPIILTIYVPDAAIDVYKNDEFFKKYINYIQPISAKQN